MALCLNKGRKHIVIHQTHFEFKYMVILNILYKTTSMSNLKSTDSLSLIKYDNMVCSSNMMPTQVKGFHTSLLVGTKKSRIVP